MSVLLGSVWRDSRYSQRISIIFHKGKQELRLTFFYLQRLRKLSYNSYHAGFCSVIRWNWYPLNYLCFASEYALGFNFLVLLCIENSILFEREPEHLKILLSFPKYGKSCQFYSIIMLVLNNSTIAIWSVLLIFLPGDS